MDLSWKSTKSFSQEKNPASLKLKKGISSERAAGNTSPRNQKDLIQNPKALETNNSTIIKEGALGGNHQTNSNQTMAAALYNRDMTPQNTGVHLNFNMAARLSSANDFTELGGGFQTARVHSIGSFNPLTYDQTNLNQTQMNSKTIGQIAQTGVNAVSDFETANREATKQILAIKKVDSLKLLAKNESAEHFPYKQFVQYEEHQRRLEIQDHFLSQQSSRQKHQEAQKQKPQKYRALDDQEREQRVTMSIYRTGEEYQAQRQRQSESLGYQTAREGGYGLMQTQSQSNLFPQLSSTSRGMLLSPESRADPLLSSRAERAVDTLKSLRAMSRQQNQPHTYRVSSQQKNFDHKVLQSHNQMQRKEHELVMSMRGNEASEKMNRKFEKTKETFSQIMTITRGIPKLIKCADKVLDKAIENKTKFLEQFITDQKREQTALKAQRQEKRLKSRANMRLDTGESASQANNHTELFAIVQGTHHSQKDIPKQVNVNSKVLLQINGTSASQQLQTRQIDDKNQDLPGLDYVIQKSMRQDEIGNNQAVIGPSDLTINRRHSQPKLKSQVFSYTEVETGNDNARKSRVIEVDAISASDRASPSFSSKDLQSQIQKRTYSQDKQARASKFIKKAKDMNLDLQNVIEDKGQFLAIKQPPEVSSHSVTSGSQHHSHQDILNSSARGQDLSQPDHYDGAAQGKHSFKDVKFYRRNAKNYFFPLEIFDEEARDDPDPVLLVQANPTSLYGYSKFFKNEEEETNHENQDFGKYLQENLEKHNRAKDQIFASRLNNVSWERCQILGYDESTSLFAIKFVDRGDIVKQVKRLNLIYEFEDLQRFEKRIQKAKERQRLHECLVRYTGHLLHKANAVTHSNASEDLILIQPQMIKRIIQLTNGIQVGKGKSKSMKEPLIGNQKSRITKQFDQDFMRVLAEDFLKFYRFIIIKHSFDQENMNLIKPDFRKLMQDKDIWTKLRFIKSIILGSRRPQKDEKFQYESYSQELGGFHGQSSKGILSIGGIVRSGDAIIGGLNHKQVVKDLKGAGVSSIRRRITDTMIDLITSQEKKIQHYRDAAANQEAESGTNSMSEVKEESKQDQNDDYYDEAPGFHASKTRRLERQMSDILIDAKRMISEDSSQLQQDLESGSTSQQQESRKIRGRISGIIKKGKKFGVEKQSIEDGEVLEQSDEDSSSIKDELDEDEYSQQKSIVKQTRQSPPFEEPEDEKVFKDKILDICTTIELNSAYTVNDKQEQLLKQIFPIFKQKRSQNVSNLEKQRPKSLALILVIFPKIIRYIKSISEISFFKGFQIVQDQKKPLTLKQFEETVLNKQASQINKVKSICQTAENTLNNMMYDLVNNCKGDAQIRQELEQRFNRLTRICNIFLESTLKVSITQSFDDVYKFLRKFYSILPLYGIYSARIASLCEDYMLLQLSEQRKGLEMTEIPELEDKIKEMEKNSESQNRKQVNVIRDFLIRQIQKKIEKKRTFSTMLSLRKQQSIISQITTKNQSVKNLPQSPQQLANTTFFHNNYHHIGALSSGGMNMMGIEGEDITPQFDSENLVKEVIIFINKQYQQSAESARFMTQREYTASVSRPISPDGQANGDGKLKPALKTREIKLLNLFYQFYAPYSQRKLSPLIMMEIISRKRFTILKRTLMTPKVLKGASEQVAKLLEEDKKQGSQFVSGGQQKTRRDEKHSHKITQEELEAQRIKEEEQKLLQIESIISNSLFGRKIRVNQKNKLYKIPHQKGAFTISIGDLNRAQSEQAQNPPLQSQKSSISGYMNDAKRSYQTFHGNTGVGSQLKESKIDFSKTQTDFQNMQTVENGKDDDKDSMKDEIIEESQLDESNQSILKPNLLKSFVGNVATGHNSILNAQAPQQNHKLNILEDDSFFLVVKVKRVTINDLFNLINKDFFKQLNKQPLISRLNSQKSNQSNQFYAESNDDFVTEHSSPNTKSKGGDIGGKAGTTNSEMIDDIFPEEFLEKYFPWFSETDFQTQAIFFKPTFNTLISKLKQLLLDPISKLQQISVIKAPEIIKEPYIKPQENFEAHVILDAEKVKQELDSVFCYSLLGPLAFLALLRQYDYLIIYGELDYLSNLDHLSDIDDLENLQQEYRLLRQDQHEIGLKFPDEVSFGLLVVDIRRLKYELISTCDYLAKYISDIIKKKFLGIQEQAWSRFDEIKVKLQQAIETKEIFIDLKKYISNSNFEKDLDTLRFYLQKCKKLEAVFEKFATYVDEVDYERYWLSFQWEWRLKQFKDDTVIRMNKCIQRFKEEVIQEAEIVKNQISQIGRQINQVYKLHFDMENAESYSHKISDAVEKLKAFNDKSVRINEQEQILGLSTTNYSEIQDYLNVGEPLRTLWTMVKNWHIENDKYLNLYFIDLNKDEVEHTVRKTYDTIESLEDKLNFEDTTSPKLVLERIQKELDDFCESCMPVIMGLISEKIRQRHWNELRDHLYASQINQNVNTGLEGDLNSLPQLRANEITLKYLLEENITALIPIIQQIREKAEKEFENEIYIENLALEIKGYEVQFVTTKEGNILIKDARDHANILQDYNFNSKIKLKNDLYILPFEEHLKELQFKLKTMKHYMEQIDRLQKNFLLLSEAFRLHELQVALANELKEFEEIDKEFYQRMKASAKAQQQNFFLQNVSEEDYLRLRHHNERLRIIRATLKRYFADRRERFPRFFFLSDQQLMNLTCSQNTPKIMNIYLRYCFRGIKELMLDEKQEKIVGCLGVKNEILTFQEPVVIKTSQKPGLNLGKPEGKNNNQSQVDQKQDDKDHEENQGTSLAKRKLKNTAYASSSMNNHIIGSDEKYNVDIITWMQEMELQIRWTMKTVIRRCIIERDDSLLEEWLYSPSFNEQTYLIVEAIKFNYDISMVFDKDGIEGLKHYLTKVKKYAKTIINFIHFDDAFLRQQDERNSKHVASKSQADKPQKSGLQNSGSGIQGQNIQDLSLNKQQRSDSSNSQHQNGLTKNMKGFQKSSDTEKKTTSFGRSGSNQEENISGNEAASPVGILRSGTIRIPYTLQNRGPSNSQPLAEQVENEKILSQLQQKEQDRQDKQRELYRSSRRIVFESLYLQKLQQIEVLEQLIQSQITDLMSFEWVSQLKFSLEIEQHRLDDRQTLQEISLQNQKRENATQQFKPIINLLDSINTRDDRNKKLEEQKQVRSMMIAQAASSSQGSSTTQIQQEIDTLLAPLAAEEEKGTSLRAAMRNRIRMEVEAQALRAEKDRLNIEKILRLQKLYANVLEVTDSQAQQQLMNQFGRVRQTQQQEEQSQLFEYSNEYITLKKEKKDFAIFGYLLSFYQSYGFEFTPSEGHMLVNSPLTQRTLYSLFQCVSSQIGGLIYGPQGVGKTETIQNFARSLAKPFILWSCRGGCSYNGLSRIFAGMAIGGWWLCMDEINHLEVQILSTFIQQVLNIKHAVYMHKDKIEVNLSGGSVKVPFNRNFGLFATFTYNQSIPFNNLVHRESKKSYCMNAQNLPHIIYENFRPIYMLVPDVRIILNSRLMILGFQNTLTLATKIHTCLQLMSENMTQYHTQRDSSAPFENLTYYCLSLRTLTLITNKLRYLLRTFTFKQDVTEDYIIANALRGAFFYQMNPNQVQAFDGIVANVFRGVAFNDVVAFSVPQEQKMNEALTAVISQGQYASSEQLLIKSKQLLSSLAAVTKAKQARQQQQISHAVLVVGRSMSGKTELVSIVARAFQKLTHRPFNMHQFNVNSQTLDQFYGHYDLKGQWQDGLLPQLILKCLTKLSEEQQAFLREDCYKSLYITDRINENVKASANINEVRNPKFNENSYQRQGTRGKMSYSRKQSLNSKSNRNRNAGAFSDSTSTDLQQNTSMNDGGLGGFGSFGPNLYANHQQLFETQRDWIILDGSVKENFHNSTHISWFERLSTLLEKESEFICLASGDSVRAVNSDLKYIIETTSIHHISPALLNRVQLISIDHDLIEDSMLFTRYLVSSNQFPRYFNPHQSMLTRLFNRILVPLINRIKGQTPASDRAYNSLGGLPLAPFPTNVNISQTKLVVNDFINIFKIQVDEAYKALICSKKIDLRNLEDAESPLNGGDKNSEHDSVTSRPTQKRKESHVMTNLNLFDKFQVKYSVKARRNQDLEQEKLTFEQEVNCLQSLFIESLKFVISNVVSSTHHYHATVELKQIIRNLISDGKLESDFAFNFLAYLDQNFSEVSHKSKQRFSSASLDCNQSVNSTFLFDHYFDYSILKWQSFDKLNPQFKFCTHSGASVRGKRRFSISEEFRLNAKYRESKGNVLSRAELDRKVNFKFDLQVNSILTSGIGQSSTNQTNQQDMVSIVGECLYFGESSIIQRNNYYFRLLQSYGQNIMVFGPIQSGKTAMVRNKIALDMKFRDLRQSKINRYIQYVMNPLTKVSDLKRIVESNMEMQRVGVYVPPSKQNSYLIIDDVNMANPNLERDCARPLELLREYFELGGWYSRTQTRFNFVQQLQVAICYTIREGGLQHGNRQLTDRLLRHFTKLFIPSLKKEDLYSIFSQYVERAFDSKHDKFILDVSRRFIDSLSSFVFNGLEKHYSDSKAFGINFSISTAVQAIQRVIQVDLSKLRTDKIQVAQVWIDSLKRHFLYQFPIIFSSTADRDKYNERIFDSRMQQKNLKQDDPEQDSFLSSQVREDDESSKSSGSQSESDSDSESKSEEDSNQSQDLSKLSKHNVSSDANTKFKGRMQDKLDPKSRKSNTSAANKNDKSNVSNNNNPSNVGKVLKLQSYNEKVRQYTQEFSRFLLQLAQQFYQEQQIAIQQKQSSRHNLKNSSSNQPQIPHPNQLQLQNQQSSQPTPSIQVNPQELSKILLKQLYMVNNDVFERIEDPNKSFEYDVQLMEEDHYRLASRDLKNVMRKFIFQDDSIFKHEFLRMENAQYDKMTKLTLDLLRQLEQPLGHVLLKSNYDLDSSFLVFLCKVCCQFLRYTPLNVSLSSPEFNFYDFIREFNQKIEDTILRKRSKIVLVVEMENYNLSHSLNDIDRQGFIAQFLYFLQAVSTGSRFQHLLNYQEMKIILEKIRLREYTTQQSYDFENSNEEQIMYCLNQDIMRNVKIVFLSNHSRGGFLFDQVLLHRYKINDSFQSDYQILESLGYLAVYCKELFQLCRVVNVDFSSYPEENLNFQSCLLEPSFPSQKQQNQGQKSKRDKQREKQKAEENQNRNEAGLKIKIGALSKNSKSQSQTSLNVNRGDPANNIKN